MFPSKKSHHKDYKTIRHASERKQRKGNALNSSYAVHVEYVSTIKAAKGIV